MHLRTRVDRFFIAMVTEFFLFLLVCFQVARTIKFLSGMSLCKHVVTPDWLIRSGARGVLQGM